MAFARELPLMLVAVLALSARGIRLHIASTQRSGGGDPTDDPHVLCPERQRGQRIWLDRLRNKASHNLCQTLCPNKDDPKGPPQSGPLWNQVVVRGRKWRLYPDELTPPEMQTTTTTTPKTEWWKRLLKPEVPQKPRKLESWETETFCYEISTVVEALLINQYRIYKDNETNDRDLDFHALDYDLEMSFRDLDDAVEDAVNPFRSKYDPDLVCRMPSSPSGLGETTTTTTRADLIVTPSVSGFWQAEEWCAANGGHLASIHSATDLCAIIDIMADKYLDYAWSGAHWAGSMKWTDQSPWGTFQPWREKRSVGAHGVPDDSTGYVQISGGRWENAPPSRGWDSNGICRIRPPVETQCEEQQQGQALWLQRHSDNRDRDSDLYFGRFESLLPFDDPFFNPCRKLCPNEDDPVSYDPLWNQIVIRGGTLKATSKPDHLNPSERKTAEAEPVCYEIYTLRRSLQVKEKEPLTMSPFSFSDVDDIVRDALDASSPNHNPELVCRMPPSRTQVRETTMTTTMSIRAGLVMTPTNTGFWAAEQWCVEKGGHLASIHSSADLCAMIDVIVAQSFQRQGWAQVWIGAHFRNNTIEWTDRSTWDYHPTWAIPPDDSMPFMQLLNDGRWFAFADDEVWQRRGICRLP